jgi:hypothetical protein
VRAPSFGAGVFTVREDHGAEVVLSNGERIYKAKCTPCGGVKDRLAARLAQSEKIGRGRVVLR